MTFAALTSAFSVWPQATHENRAWEVRLADIVSTRGRCGRHDEAKRDVFEAERGELIGRLRQSGPQQIRARVDPREPYTVVRVAIQFAVSRHELDAASRSSRGR